MTNDEQTIRGKLFIRGKIKSQKLIFWKEEREIEGEGDGKLVDDSLVENFIDSFIHGGRRGGGDSHLLHKQSNANALAVKPKARCIPAGVALIKSSSLSMALPPNFDRNGIPSK